ncbi:MAG: DUF1294 domain-containing protein [Clostridia bacterium]|nr:DUF1294 domain-containing protein [Clostridia bacterium]
MLYIPLGWAIAYSVIMNGLGLFLMLWDRHLAKSRSRKWVNELLMQFVAFLGGAPAMTVIMYATRHKLRKRKFNIFLPLMTLVHLATIVLVALFGPRFTFCVEVDILYVVLYLAVVSIVAMALTYADKHFARRNLHRIQEDTFMLWAGLGGAAAMLLAMLCFRHKTKHIKFMLGLPIMIVLQGLLFFWLWACCDFILFMY